MTTPESLEVMCISKTVNEVELFKHLRFIIIDEIHALAGSDRGAHLRSVLGRILKHSQHDVQRIGLSATVGNPETILSWLSSGSKRPGLVVNPPAPRSKKEISIVHRDNEEALALAAATIARGSKSLLFCQSRGFTETVAEQMSKQGVDVYVHHSSISKEERDQAEALFQREGAACIVCTSTLELGIDIGDLDKVFQAEAPDTVSSFMQRMGRTGRRKDQNANTTFFCMTKEGVLQATALVELAKSGWVESVRVNQRSWPVLVHQVMAICLAHGGIGTAKLWEHIQQVPDFAEVTEAEFYRLIAYMLKDQGLEQASGRLILGSKAEKLFGRRNFMEMYAVFSSPQMYKVETKSKHPIGQLTQDFVDQLNLEGCFLLGGRAWAINQINHNERRIQVEPAPQGKEPTWGGILPQFLGVELCQKIKELLCDVRDLPYLRGRAQELLQEERSELDGVIRHHYGGFVIDDDSILWWTFAGGRINSTLRYALQAVTGWRIQADNFSLRIRGNDLTQGLLEEKIKHLQDAEFWSDEKIWKPLIAGLPAYRLSKFQALMPQWVVQEMLADYLLDLDGTWHWLTGTKEAKEEALKPTETMPKSSDSVEQPTGPVLLPHSPVSQWKLPIHWIETQEGLEEVCQRFSEAQVLGFDVETTIPATTLCLIQVASHELIAVIDPLQVVDLTPLKTLLESEEIVKVAHNASFERRQMENQGIGFNNVFDTLKASRKLRGTKTEDGEKLRHGLGVVCKRELGMEMDKGEQSSNWLRRPLTRSQLSYAALDAEVMLQLYELFQEETEEPKQIGLFSP
jgi:ATP-dependent Lhr-like helicase